MLISVRWLGRHIDLNGLSAEAIANALTLCTAEVEQVEQFLPHASEIVVGHVLTREQHPGADRLSLCSVDIGQPEPVPIVCGAGNVAAGQKVPVALPGTIIPGIGKLKKSKIRGERSLGMICSEAEVGLTDNSDGIWVLPDAAKVGEALPDAMQFADSIIDIDNKSLTHRPDLWGHRGIAGELSAIFERPLLPLDLSFPETGSEPCVPVSLQTDACSQYVALPIEGVKSQPSPLWLRSLLVAVGQRSRGQLVDLSNFVMLDIGQPNHTFDRAQLSASGVVVRKARAGECLETLDGQELKLDVADVLITSEEQPVALAGVMGGKSSEVTDSTSALVLEVATFDATMVRHSSVRHSLRTESSARFEKTLDANLPLLAAAHFARLLQTLQPEVKLPSAPTSAGPPPPASFIITLQPARVRAALGAPLTDAQIEALLLRLAFGVQRQGEQMLVKVPTIRGTKDVRIAQDLIEEVGRLFGYGNIPESCLSAEVRPPPRDERRNLVRAIQDRLSGAARFTETIRYSFQSDALLELLGMAELPHARLANPVVATESRMRRSLVPSLLSNIESNRRYRQEVRLYEVGKCYFPELAESEQPLGEPLEQHTVGLLWATEPEKKNGHFQGNPFAQLQGVIDDLLGSLERPAMSWRPGQIAPSWSQPQHCVEAVFENGSVVARVATLATGISAQLGLTGRLASQVVLAEISLEALLKAPRVTRRYQPIVKYPGIKVDVAVAVAEVVPSGDITGAIVLAAGKHCRSVELFDVYQGDAVGEGMKSLAYHVLLQSADKTLSDKEEQKFLNRLSGSLDKLGAQLRDG